MILGPDRIRLLVFGMGYSARAAVAHLKPKLERVQATVREPQKFAELQAVGVEPLGFDGARHSSPPDAQALRDAITEADHILVSIPPGEDGDPVLRHFRDELADARPRSVVYLSTVGVYGDHDGAWVDEATPCWPVSRRSRERVEAELAWRQFGEESGVAVAIIRLAGIYGPGRGPFEKIRRGTARRIVKPGQVFNRIHVDDIARIVAAAFEREAGGIFNGTDDEPAPPEQVLGFAAELLGLALPPLVAFEDAEMTPMARSFYGENKRVRNERIKEELGVNLACPTYREGLRQVLRSEQTARPAAVMLPSAESTKP